MRQARAWIVHFPETGGGDCVYDHAGIVKHALEANGALRVTALFPGDELENGGWRDARKDVPLGKGTVYVAYRQDNGDGDGTWHYVTAMATFGIDGWYNESGVGRFKHALRIDWWFELPKLSEPKP